MALSGPVVFVDAKWKQTSVVKYAQGTGEYGTGLAC
jgi:hypothetical protein